MITISNGSATFLLGCQRRNPLANWQNALPPVLPEARQPLCSFCFWFCILLQLHIQVRLSGGFNHIWYRYSIFQQHCLSIISLYGIVLCYSIKGALSRWCLPLLNKLGASSMICSHEYTQHLIFCWGTGGSQHIKKTYSSTTALCLCQTTRGLGLNLTFWYTSTIHEWSNSSRFGKIDLFSYPCTFLVVVHWELMGKIELKYELWQF